MSGPWLALGYCGYEFNLTLWPFDLHIGPMPEDEEPEPVSEAGSWTSQPIGYAPDPRPPWCDPGSPHTYDPGEEMDRRR